MRIFKWLSVLLILANLIAMIVLGKASGEGVWGIAMASLVAYGLVNWLSMGRVNSWQPIVRKEDPMGYWTFMMATSGLALVALSWWWIGSFVMRVLFPGAYSSQ